MAGIPDFILRKLVVKDSLKVEADGFSFELLNTFAPASVTRFSLRVNGRAIDPGDVKGGGLFHLHTDEKETDEQEKIDHVAKAAL